MAYALISHIDGMIHSHLRNNITTCMILKSIEAVLFMVFCKKFVGSTVLDRPGSRKLQASHILS